MPFQLKPSTGHHHGAAMDGKPPPPTPQAAPAPPLPAPAPPRVSRLRRLLVRVSASERLPPVAAGEEKPAAVGAGEADVGSVGLDRMVLSFMEESAAVVERPPRGRCNCFNGSNYEESDDEEDFFLPSGLASAPPPAAAGETLEALKVPYWNFSSHGGVRRPGTRIETPQIGKNRSEFDVRESLDSCRVWCRA